MYNRVILMGRLTADPELKQTQSGIAMCRVSVAVDRGFAKQGEEKKTDFFDVTFWRQQAEFVSKYFSKGRMIHIEGRLQQDNYTDQNGQKQYRISVQADNVSFCGDKSSNQNQQQGGGYAQTGYYQQQPYQAPAQPYQAPPQPQYQQPAQQYRPAPPPQPQYAQAPAPPPYQAPAQPQPNLSDFEEILADGTVPF